MTGWRSTKDGRHFQTRTKPGVNSNDNHSNHSGSQSSSMHQSNHKSPKSSKDIPVSCDECKRMFVDKLRPGPKFPHHTCLECGQKKDEEDWKTAATVPVSCNECKRMFMDKDHRPQGYHCCPKCDRKTDELAKALAQDQKMELDEYFKEEKREKRAASKEKRELKKLGLTANQYDKMTFQLQKKAAKDKKNVDYR